MTILHTPRLRLEPMAECHYEGLQAMNSLPEVMRYISGRPETPEQTRAAIARVQQRWTQWGYSWWCFIDLASGRVAGAGCIQHLGGETTNPLEIGWRLHPDFQGRGLALEAAQRMAHFAFDELRAPELRAICDPANERSAHLMRKLGMQYLGSERWHDADVAVYAVSAVKWHQQFPPLPNRDH
jgi:RimJ/RimL family protein N-acetyltransferase